MNIEKFIHQWWSDSPSMQLGGEEFIKESYQENTLFWKKIFDVHASSQRTPVESQLGKLYNFYHDCILRHLADNETALTIVSENRTENWSYRKLHQCVNAQVKRWTRSEVKPGQIVAIRAEPGITFILALLTSLRLGLSICFLPSGEFLGDKCCSEFIEKISALWIISEKDLKALPQGVGSLSIDPSLIESEDEHPLSYAYEASSIGQYTISLYRQDSLALVPLDVDTMYLHALRDSLLLFNLREWNTWSYPLANPLECEPCHTLITLLAGARKVWASNKTLRDNPAILKEEKIQVLFLSDEAQEMWTRVQGLPVRSLKAICKTPFNINYRAWKNFTQFNRIDKIPVFNGLTDNSIGGIKFISRPSLENFDSLVKVNLGLQWSMNQMGTEAPSVTGFGVAKIYSTNIENNSIEGNLTVSMVENDLLVTGTAEPCREGITYPIDLLENIVKGISFVEDCIIYSTPKLGKIGSHQFTLLIFIDPGLKNYSSENKNEWDQAVNLQIKERLGKFFLPDKIEYYPLLPQARPWGIDRDWCSTQYSRGLLSQKSINPLYQLLHQLKKFAKDQIKHAET